MPQIAPYISATAPSHDSRPVAAPAIRVVLLDLLSMVPYYTGHLCAGFRRIEGSQVTLAAITYDHDPEFFSRMNIRPHPGFLDLTSRLRRAPAPIRRGLKLVGYLLNLAALLIQFMRSRPDILHVQFLPLLSYGLPVERWFLKLARALGAKLVYTVHNLLPQDSGERHRRVYHRIYQLADGLICHDALSAGRLVAEFSVPLQRISVIPHGTLFEQTAKIQPECARAKLGFAAGDCIVLWQGILRPYKGVSFLLHAWQHVYAKESTARLVILGTGDRPEVEAVRREARALDKSGVRLELRFVSVDELAEFYTAADILAYPYREITTSGALMTGVVHGKAIVASALPAFEQILSHESNALLVPYGDVDALAANLLRLIREPALRARLARGLRESNAALPRWPEIARRTDECYRALISRQTCPAGIEENA